MNMLVWNSWVAGSAGGKFAEFSPAKMIDECIGLFEKSCALL